MRSEDEAEHRVGGVEGAVRERQRLAVPDARVHVPHPGGRGAGAELAEHGGREVHRGHPARGPRGEERERARAGRDVEDLSLGRDEAQRSRANASNWARFSAT